ncbi:MAG: ATP-binding cassette domain-containing protein [Acidobacteria bacterium]|nr:ATP-binding cassette domain-containing protein [Acidobacteriota bacterium]
MTGAPQIDAARPDAGGLEPADAVQASVIVEHVSFAFGDHRVLQDVSFSVRRGSMLFLLGPSGSGKSVLLKLLLGLYRPDSGAITVNGHRIDRMTERELLAVRRDIGMVFQENALFDSLTVNENVGYRLYEETDMPLAEARARVEEVLGFVGLGEYIERLPSELSGGQRRRVGLARGMATKPSLLLFDDPTTGLDPLTAATVDNEIVKLRDLERVTAIVATHQIRDAFYIATHEAVRRGDAIEIVQVDNPKTADFILLNDGRIHFEGHAAEILASDDPYVREFLYNTLPPW